jgi:hypothetical protein
MTKAQALGITEFPYEEFDDAGHRTYYEDASGYWQKVDYDSDGYLIGYEDTNEYWVILTGDDCILPMEEYDTEVREIELPHPPALGTLE